MMPSRVDFPAPFGPTMATICASENSRVARPGRPGQLLEPGDQGVVQRVGLVRVQSHRGDHPLMAPAGEAACRDESRSKPMATTASSPPRHASVRSRHVSSRSSRWQCESTRPAARCSLRIARHGRHSDSAWPRTHRIGLSRRSRFVGRAAGPPRRGPASARSRRPARAAGRLVCALAQMAQDLGRRRWDDRREGDGDEAQAGGEGVEHGIEPRRLRLVLGELPGRLLFDQTVEPAHEVPDALERGRDLSASKCAPRRATIASASAATSASASAAAPAAGTCPPRYLPIIDAVRDSRLPSSLASSLL